MPTQTEEPQPSARFGWWRIVLGALMLEIGLALISVPAFYFPNPQFTLQVIVPPAAMLVSAAAGAWAARPSSHPVLAGAGVGVVSLVFYALLVLVALQFAPAEQADASTALSPAYIVGHLLKVVGGGLGGYWMARRRTLAPLR